jgi:hypothetical protein
VKGQRIEIFKNLKNIFLINNQHRLKSYKLGNIEKISKEFFFRLTKFFFRNKKKLFKEQLLFSFLCIGKQKSENFWRFLFFKIYLTIFEKQKFSKIFGSIRNFFLLFNTLKTEQKLFLGKNFFVPEKKFC